MSDQRQNDPGGIIYAANPKHYAQALPRAGGDDTLLGGAGDDLYIAYTPAINQDPGSYSGTITLTVADN